MKHIFPVVWIALLGSGCIEGQLHYNTLELTSTVEKIQYDQVLDNLALFLDSPGNNTLPAVVDLSSGSVQVADQFSPSFKFPFSGMITREADLTIQRQWTENWSITPVHDASDLERLQALFHDLAVRNGETPVPLIYVKNPVSGQIQVETVTVIGADGKPVSERKPVVDPERRIDLPNLDLKFWTEHKDNQPPRKRNGVAASFRNPIYDPDAI